MSNKNKQTFWSAIRRVLFFLIMVIGTIILATNDTDNQRNKGNAQYDYSITSDAIPRYEGDDVTVLNNNKPYTDFSGYEPTQEEYSPLDKLGRCGPATAILCPETLPDEERGQIGHVKPSGWHSVKYNGIIDGNYLYNRCHLIAYSLAGENDNKLNLITGTRHLNVNGMLPYEMRIFDYIKETGNPVGYRVTPLFKDSELVCRGVLIEAMSLNDNEIQFCVFVHNIQPGISINYLTGESQAVQ